MTGVLVCTACGSLGCWQGDFMCEDATHADTAVCTCEWSEDGSAWRPLIVHPDCPTHGEPS